MIEDKLEEKDPSIHSFTLSGGCSRPDAVKWSPDGRIAVLTDSYIYVLVSFRQKVKVCGYFQARVQNSSKIHDEVQQLLKIVKFFHFITF